MDIDYEKIDGFHSLMTSSQLKEIQRISAEEKVKEKSLLLAGVVEECATIIDHLSSLEPHVNTLSIDINKFKLINQNLNEAQMIFILKGFDCNYRLEKSPNGRREMILKW